MGFLTRTFVPRSVRRAASPVRSTKSAVRRAVVPKPVRKVTYGVSQARSPLSAAAYHGIERPLKSATSSSKKRSGTRAPVFMHGSCAVRHRTPEAAERCRNE